MNLPAESSPELQIFETNPGQSEIKMLLYGPSGSGKTFSSTHLNGDFGKMLYVNLEVKDASVPRGTNQVRVMSLKDLGETCQKLERGEWDFDIVVVDSITEFGDRLLTGTKDERLRKLQSASTKEQKAKAAKQASLILAEPELGIMSQSGWGVAGDRLVQGIRRLRDLPCHVIMTALEDRTQDDVRRVTKMPDVFGNYAKKRVPKLFSHVGHMEPTETEDGMEYLIRFAHSRSAWAKSEGGLLEVVEPANMTAIFNKLLNNE